MIYFAHFNGQDNTMSRKREVHMKFGINLIITGAFLFPIGCTTDGEKNIVYPSSGAQQQEESIQDGRRIDSVDDYPLTDSMKEGYRSY